MRWEKILINVGKIYFNRQCIEVLINANSFYQETGRISKMSNYFKRITILFDENASVVTSRVSRVIVETIALKAKGTSRIIFCSRLFKVFSLHESKRGMAQ